MTKWITEKQSPHLKLSAEVDQIYFDGQSDFQHIEVAHSLEYGNMLSLDGVFQTSEKDEFVYHEMIAHVPLFLHPNPKNVLIIGGGDGGVARECVRHACVDKVTMVEIDGKVVELAKKYLPSIANAMICQDPKLTVKIGDGIGYMAQAEDEYDVIIVDCSDPIGPGKGLFTKEFYANTFKALKKDGLFVQQTESPFMHRQLVADVNKYIRAAFPITRLYTAYIPLYPTGMHCFTIGSKTIEPLTWQPNRTQDFATKYYNTDMHKAAFALPNFVKDYLYKK
ncbi:MAG: polyamine aminopropyltransferase [Veillonellaceae bacterium]|nr:polyamine aminopropyltransferase [Veillonellaceae bacterium]